MKNTMKKLMSLLLVAVLLVSAVPFQASAATVSVKSGTTFTWNDAPDTITKADMYAYMEMAAGDDADLDASLDAIFANGSLTAAEIQTIDVDAGTVVKKSSGGGGEQIEEINPPVDDEEEDEEVKDPMDYVEMLRPGADYVPEFTLRCVVNGTRTWTSTEKADGTTFGDIMDNHFTEDEGYSYKLTSRVYSKILDTVAVPAGDTVTIFITTDYADKSEGGYTTTPGYDNILNNGSSNNNSGSNNNGSNNGSNSTGGNGTSNGPTYNGSNGGTEVNKFPYDVVLNVYLNNNVGTINKKITLNTGIALDGKVTYSEVKNLLKNYYTAKDSDGLQLDGLYLATGNWVGHFAYDMAKYETLNNLDEERKAHEVNIIVMLTNANSKTSSVASSDNPKTGDAIYACVTIMGVSATALAVLYFYNKKRAF